MGYQAVAAPGNVSAVHLDGQVCISGAISILAEESGISTIATVFNISGQNGTEGGVKYLKNRDLAVQGKYYDTYSNLR